MSSAESAALQQSTVLDAPSLMAQASAETGLDDYGNKDFVEPLTRLVDAVREEAGLGAMGLMGFGMDIVQKLQNRLRFQDDLKKHPEIADEDVSDPIIIFGLARTGTTKLQRVMACDPQLQKMLMWQGINPAPLSGTQGMQPDPRIAIGEANAEAFRQASPDFQLAHSMAAEYPEEETLLLKATFETPSDGWYYRIPTYLSWLTERPRNGAYKGLCSMLQYLQWQDGGRRGRPWVLKSPIHLGQLDEILDAFPKATIVHCHRDPAVAMPSLCRLIELMRAAVGSECVDPLEIGEFLVGYCSTQWERQLEQLSRLHDRTNIVDVQYGQIRDDVIEVIRDIYRSRGMALSPAAAQMMVQWQTENPQHREGKWDYSLERYGLSEQKIAQAFKTYFDCFPVAKPFRQAH